MTSSVAATDLPLPAVMSSLDSVEAWDGNGNVTVISLPTFLTVTSVAFKSVVLSSPVGADCSVDADADADAGSVDVPLDVPDVLEQAPSASARAAVADMVAMRTRVEVICG